MKFLVDACVGHRLAEWLRQQGHDVAETRERGPDPGDHAILEWAAAEERVLVTMDKDFGAFVFVKGSPHCGLLRLPDVPTGRRIELVNDVLKNHSRDLASRSIITVRGDRIRISRPPG